MFFLVPCSCSRLITKLLITSQQVRGLSSVSCPLANMDTLTSNMKHFRQVAAAAGLKTRDKGGFYTCVLFCFDVQTECVFTAPKEKKKK